MKDAAAAAVVGVLQADQPGAGAVNIVGANVVFQEFDGEQVARCSNWPGGDAE